MQCCHGNQFVVATVHTVGHAVVMVTQVAQSGYPFNFAISLNYYYSIMIGGFDNVICPFYYNSDHTYGYIHK